VLYTEDILNVITQPNYPEQRRLILKVGMPVILMRNLNPGIGLHNGTRLLITRLADCVLEVTDMISSSSGLNKHTGALEQ
jgi:ATP-dependent DNA helicase PIF1